MLLIDVRRILVPKKYFLRFRDKEIKKHELNYLFWECTLRCNLNCLHCGSDCKIDSYVPDMPIADFLNAFKTIPNVSKNFIVVLTGGEPLMRNDIEQFGYEIRKLGAQWSLVSNGILYSPERHNSLINAGLGALTISLDGLENTHNWLRNSGNTFNRVKDAIALAASESRLNFDVVTCVNPSNIHQLGDIKNLLIELGVKAWRLFTIAEIGRAANNPELILDKQAYKYLLEFIKSSRKNNKINVQYSCEAYTGKYEKYIRDSYFFCRAGVNIGSILANGSISACPNNSKYLIQGNIYQDNFYEVWQNKYQLFRDRQWTKQGECAECKEFKSCMGSGMHLHQGEDLKLITCHKLIIDQ
ncbi:MAG: radical SAM protein [Bacteroidales bacterium]|nr:radical SAM protein [Bacteroidales bacterium]